MKETIFPYVKNLQEINKFFGEVYVEYIDDGETKEIISIHGENLVAVIMMWASGDLSFDLLSRKEEGSKMANTSFFNNEYQNIENISEFLEEFRNMDKA